MFDLPNAFYISTAIIILSSTTMHWAILSVKKNKIENTRLALMITLALGLGFAFTQFLGWSQLVDNGIYFTGNPSGSFFICNYACALGHMVAAIIVPHLNVNLKC